MANPLDAFKGLKGWQKGAVVIGGVAAVGGLVLYERKQKAAAAAPAAAGAAGASASVAGMVTDPTTGQSYPIDDTDPVSGLTYGTEIQEYGSVAAADEEATAGGGAAAEEGLTQTEYGYETGQSAAQAAGSRTPSGSPKSNRASRSSATPTPTFRRASPSTSAAPRSRSRRTARTSTR